MALNFPNSPVSGQEYVAPNGVTYVYNITTSLWDISQEGYIGTLALEDSAVTEAKLNTNSVSVDKIQDDSITQAKIQDDAVRNNHIEADSISNDKIQDDAVRDNHIQANAVTNDAILANAVTKEKCVFINSNNRFYAGNDTDNTSIMAGRNQDGSYMSSINRAIILYHSSNSYMKISSRNSSTDSYAIQFRRSGTDRFRVSAVGDLTNATGSYGQISDIKLKENIESASSQWDDLLAIRVCNFNFKPETGLDTNRQIGWIANEVEEVCPSLVEDQIGVDDNDKPTGEVTKTVKSSVIFIKAVKALQEAMTRIEALELEVKELKGNQ